MFDYLRDMSDESESAHVTRCFFPARILRGVLLAVVLLPVVGLLFQRPKRPEMDRTRKDAPLRGIA